MTPNRSVPAGNAAASAGPARNAAERLVWCDIAKGIAIILVANFHAVNGVVFDAPSFGGPFDEATQRMLVLPLTYFRMPLFFFASGVFAALSVRRDWLRFTDRTLLHLAYIFVLWNVIFYTMRAMFPGLFNVPNLPSNLLLFLLDPFDVTWFVEVLLLFYIVIRALRDLPPFVLVAAGAVLAVMPASDYYVIERSQTLFVYFALGYAASAWMRADAWQPGNLLTAALVVAFALTSIAFALAGLDSNRPLVLPMSCLGVLAATSAAMWLSRRRYMGWLIYIGRHTLPIFILHISFGGAARELLLRTGVTTDTTVLIVVATLVGIVGPLLVFVAFEFAHVPWLFERPAFLHLPTPARPVSSTGN